LKNYYRILNLKPEATQAEIKKAYRLLAVKYHPDKNDGDSSSEERFKEIAEAYLILGDTAKRNAYDFSKGYRSSFRDSSAASQGQTPSTFLILFKKVKNRVLDSGGRINQNALFKVIDDLLTDENIRFLINYGDTGTTSIIIDDIVTSSTFLGNSKRAKLHIKLIQLADGHTWLTEKANKLKESSVVGENGLDPESVEKPALISIILFIAVVFFLIVLLLI
jgi:molecular chaperone DnaJ